MVCNDYGIGVGRGVMGRGWMIMNDLLSSSRVNSFNTGRPLIGERDTLRLDVQKLIFT